ncbi:MADS box transcription factor [Handroanthus impetiginosus]|uniref:MADS box transcription factor n=1 Tax=Handroanthus impetiginosus TaxID=429701 RepID=A0A2G9GST0_9LAMI|nr:MADS box transcription factor [Handroanthus impetiginosus]
MGRAKLKLELISKEKSRILTFKKRKQGLFTKLHQLTTLCDVNACMIIYGPKQEHGATEPEIWPQNLEEVRRIIGLYEAKNRGNGSSSGNNRTSTFGLSDFFHERKRKIEEEIVRLRRKNMEAKYPTPVELLNFSTEVELREFGALLKNKAEIVKSRIEFLKGNRGGGLINENQSHDFGFFYESTAAAMGDPVISGNIPMAVPQYYQPPVVPPLPPLYMQCAPPPPPLYMQCFEMGGMSLPQVQFPLSKQINCGNDDIVEDILQCPAGGMGGVAPLLYLQCAGMDGETPPQPLPLPFLSSWEINYGNDDIFQYV